MSYLDEHKKDYINYCMARNTATLNTHDILKDINVHKDYLIHDKNVYLK